MNCLAHPISKARGLCSEFCGQKRIYWFNAEKVFMTIKNLIEFIDRHTNNGAIYPNEAWGEGVVIENEGVAFIRSFSSRDWLDLRTDLARKHPSNSWIECLIHLLDAAYTEEARQMIIHIALNGTKENFSVAMECIRGFKRDVTIYTWLKLKNRSAKILKTKANP